MSKISTCVVGVIVATVALASTSEAAIVKCEKAKGARARGSCAYAHSKDPEGWVRAYASLNTETGVVSMRFGLETDSTATGPCGRMSVLLRGDDGRDLASVKMDKKVCRGGKPPGKAARTDFTFQKAVPMKIAKQTTQVVVLVEKAGKRVRLWDIPLSVVKDAVTLGVSIFGGGDSADETT